MHLSATTIDDLLRLGFNAISQYGVRAESSQDRGSYHSIIGVLLELTNPRARLSRTKSRGKIVSCIGELVWILSGSKDLHPILPYIPDYSVESEDTITVHGAYGPRIFSRERDNQFEKILDLLHLKPSTRRAVIPILAPDDMSKERKEIPCTLQLQFRILDNRLNLMVSMRSNDAFKGLPHDVFVFTMLQEIMAKRLSIELGSYKHFVGDFHIYENDASKVKSFLNEGWGSTLSPMPEMPGKFCKDSIQAFVRAEESIRNDVSNAEVPTDLDSYWKNLIGFVGMFFARRDRNKQLMDEFRLMITEPVYQVYVHDRDPNE